MNDCLIIRGAIPQEDKTEDVFRPSTRAPSMHWAYMLVDQYSHLLNISIKWISGEPMVTLTRSAKDECEEAFKHIMEFTKLHGLDYTWCRKECEACSGHKDCVSPIKEEKNLCPYNICPLCYHSKDTYENCNRPDCWIVDRVVPITRLRTVE